MLSLLHFEHRHEEGGRVRYSTPVSSLGTGAHGLSVEMDMIPGSILGDVGWWTTIVLEVDAYRITLVENRQARASHSFGFAHFRAWTFDWTDLTDDGMWRIESLVVQATPDLAATYVVRIVCMHPINRRHAYDGHLSLRILRRIAMVRDGWKRVRRRFHLRSICLYWNDLTSHQMEVGGVAYLRDLADFETSFEHLR